MLAIFTPYYIMTIKSSMVIRATQSTHGRDEKFTQHSVRNTWREKTQVYMKG